MKPSQLSALLASTIPARLPVLIVGGPGIGKSDLVAQAARAAGARLILSHPAVADPTDVKGLPWIAKNKEAATFLPFGELAEALAATEPTVWFLDDLGQASPAVQASFMQLLLARRVNGHVLPDCVSFVAATNRRTDRAGVTGILEPVKSRFAAIVELEPDVTEWVSWAIGADMPAELIAFLRFRPELLYKFVPSADLTNCPLPRTWSHVGKLMALGLPEALQLHAYRGAVGEGAAVELMAFLRMLQQLPTIDSILLNPDKALIPTEPAVLYAVVTALAARATAARFSPVAKYVERLVAAGKAEFGIMLLRDAERRTPAVAHTREWIALTCQNSIGQLLVGQAK